MSVEILGKHSPEEITSIVGRLETDFNGSDSQSIESLKGDFTRLGMVPVEGGYNFTVAVDQNVVHAVDLCVHDPKDPYRITNRWRINSQTKEVVPQAASHDSTHVIGGFIPESDENGNWFGEGSIYSLRVTDSRWSRNDSIRLEEVPLLDPKATKVALLPGKDFGPNMNGVSVWPISMVENRKNDLAERPKPPEIARSDMNICELHVRTATGGMKMSAGNEALAGTIAGLADPSFIKYLNDQSYNAISILPLHLSTAEPHLVKQNRYNFWGYNNLSWMAINGEYAATDDPTTELKQAVDALHTADKLVIMDVVYNHTAEGGTADPTYSYEALNRLNTYKYNEHGDHIDDSGCGNTLDVTKPAVIKEIIDSLEYYVEEIGIDGFRFDLAGALSQGHHDFDQAPFIKAIAEHPVLSKKVLIAEPWGATGYYTLDQFRHTKTADWMAWNDKYREDARRVIKGGMEKQELSNRLNGHDAPDRTINYVTAHDGLTLNDFVHGDPRKQAFALALLAVSQGVPQRQAGSEFGFSQNGDHDGYSCANGELAPYFLPWEKLADPNSNESKIFAFSSIVNKIRANHPVFRQPQLMVGKVLGETPNSNQKPHPLKEKDVAWLGAFGLELNAINWHDGDKFLRQRVSGLDCDDDANFDIMINGKSTPVQVTLGSDQYPASYGVYEKIIDSDELFATDELGQGQRITDDQKVVVPPNSIVVLRQIAMRLPGAVGKLD